MNASFWKALEALYAPLHTRPSVALAASTAEDFWVYARFRLGTSWYLNANFRLGTVWLRVGGVGRENQSEKSTRFVQAT